MRTPLWRVVLEVKSYQYRNQTSLSIPKLANPFPPAIALLLVLTTPPQHQSIFTPVYTRTEEEEAITSSRTYIVYMSIYEYIYPAYMSQSGVKHLVVLVRRRAHLLPQLGVLALFVGHLPGETLHLRPHCMVLVLHVANLSQTHLSTSMSVTVIDIMRIT